MANFRPKYTALVSLSKKARSCFSSGIFTNRLAQKVKTDSSVNAMAEDSTDMDNVAIRMREMQVKGNQESRSGSSTKDHTKQVMDKLIADLKSQKGQLEKQELDRKGESGANIYKLGDRSSESDPFTPATESFGEVSSVDAKESDAAKFDAAEILRVKQELAAAKSVITRQEQELAESRTLKHTIDQAMGPLSEPDFGSRADRSDDIMYLPNGVHNATARPFAARADSWHPQEDSRSDKSEGLSGSYNRGRGIWNGISPAPFGVNIVQPFQQQTNLVNNRNTTAGWPPATNTQAGHGASSASQRVFSGPSVPTYGFEGRLADNNASFDLSDMRRATSQYNRPSTGNNNRAGPFGGGHFGAGLAPLNTSPMAGMGFAGPPGYQPPPIGTPLSATASEFTANSLPNMPSPWPQVCSMTIQTLKLLTIHR